MEQFHPLLLEVWRQACRHIDIAEACQNICTAVARHLPMDRLVIYRLDETARLIEPVAAGRADERPAPLPQATSPGTAAWRDLMRWCRQDQVTHRAAEPDAPPFKLIPRNDACDRLTGPLISQTKVIGGVVIIAPPGRSFDDNAIKRFDALREPLTVALENDERLHELITLRERAEADKRSALARLGREDFSQTIIGAEAGLNAVMQRLDQVARSDTPVLLLGETGCGKEVIARAIHDRSRHPDGPFIRVNCGAIAPDLIDSELFGHEKGAFTGAATRRRGWFERADGGTLLLDEVGELPPAAQVRLLRVLQDGMFERVGGEQSIHVHVRIIAATHRDLPAMVQDGGFRQDLWYRIAVFPIVIPPLRERPGDIAALADHFARRAATRLGLRLQVPTDADLELLAAYDWPGNIRELASVIERAAILGDGRRLEIAKALGIAALPGARSFTPIAPTSPIASMDQAMRQHIESALSQTRGRVDGPDGAARLLQINPNTLRSRMRKFNIKTRPFKA